MHLTNLFSIVNFESVGELNNLERKVLILKALCWCLMFIKFCQKEADTNISTQRDMIPLHESTLSESALKVWAWVKSVPAWAGLEI